MEKERGSESELPLKRDRTIYHARLLLPCELWSRVSRAATTCSDAAFVCRRRSTFLGAKGMAGCDRLVFDLKSLTVYYMRDLVPWQKEVRRQAKFQIVYAFYCCPEFGE